jgi:hypothetical protein
MSGSMGTLQLGKWNLWDQPSKITPAILQKLKKAGDYILSPTSGLQDYCDYDRNSHYRYA